MTRWASGAAVAQPPGDISRAKRLGSAAVDAEVLRRGDTAAAPTLPDVQYCGTAKRRAGPTTSISATCWRKMPVPFISRLPRGYVGDLSKLQLKAMTGNVAAAAVSAMCEGGRGGIPKIPAAARSGFLGHSLRFVRWATADGPRAGHVGASYAKKRIVFGLAPAKGTKSIRGQGKRLRRGAQVISGLWRNRKNAGRIRTTVLSPPWTSAGAGAGAGRQRRLGRVIYGIAPTAEHRCRAPVGFCSGDPFVACRKCGRRFRRRTSASWLTPCKAELPGCTSWPDPPSTNFQVCF